MFTIVHITVDDYILVMAQECIYVVKKLCINSTFIYVCARDNMIVNSV